MKTLKNRIVVAVALVMMFVATVVPAMAFDEGTTDGSGTTTSVTAIKATSGGVMSMMSIPVRCGSDC